MGSEMCIRDSVNGAKRQEHSYRFDPVMCVMCGIYYLIVMVSDFGRCTIALPPPGPTSGAPPLNNLWSALPACCKHRRCPRPSDHTTTHLWTGARSPKKTVTTWADTAVAVAMVGRYAQKHHQQRALHDWKMYQYDKARRFSNQ